MTAYEKDAFRNSRGPEISLCEVMLVCKSKPPTKVVTVRNGQTRTLGREGARRLTDSSTEYFD